MKTISEAKRAKITGRGKGPSFIMIPHYVMESDQWANLSGSELKLLMEFARQYRGSNNGDLSFTWEMAKARGWSSKTTWSRTLQSLETAGWIVKARQGGRHVGCSLFAVTWWPVDDCGDKHHLPAQHKPGHDWKK